jgi:energy-coupling factor transporter ATP-binding protein EcfA2
MSEARRGRAPSRFSVRRVRLVNFHNLIDETIEVPEGGHLFLLGDNGSGKTTVLDAIHLALTGTLDVELNAAARVAGARDVGRSLQGIVLRHDAERGVRNQGGAITYAVIELCDPTDDSLLSAGVGMQATTLEADVTRWAVLHRGSLDELPLVVEGPEGRVPTGRDELRNALGKNDVFAKLSEYRKALALRLFGGQTLYEEVCRFWTMAKAYREIVAKARDFAGLFMRLLPAPDAAVFQDILSSLRALDDLDGLLDGLERQRSYVAGISDLIQDIGALREEIARYQWLITFRQRGDVLARREQTAALVAESERVLGAARAEAEVAEGALEQAREALRMFSTSEGAALLDQLGQAEAELSRVSSDFGLEEHRTVEARRRLVEEEARAQAAQQAFDALYRGGLSKLSRAAERVRTLDHPLPVVLGFVDRQGKSAGRSTQALTAAREAFAEASQEVRALSAAARTRISLCDRAVARATDALSAQKAEIEALELEKEEAPTVPGFAEARRALREAGIAASPLYELLEPRAGTREEDLSGLEALLGDTALAAFVVPEHELTQARVCVLPHQGTRVVMRTASDAHLPDWISDLFATSTPREAFPVLATLLSQAASLGTVAAPDALAGLEHRGAALRVGGTLPRLVGASARVRAHQERLARARAACFELEAALVLAQRELESAQAHRSLVEELGQALTAMQGSEVLSAAAAVEASELGLGHARERLSEQEERRQELDERRRKQAALVTALRAKVAATGSQAEALELHRRELKAREAEALADHGRRLERQAELKAALAQQRGELVRLEQDIESLVVRQLERSERLRSLRKVTLAELDDEALERWVRVTQRGDQFARIENIEERLRLAERNEAAACHEIAGDGSRGVRHLEWAGRFGFGFSVETLEVRDRRDEPLANVLARIEQDLKEQREVVNDKTRELMDRLVMGELARELQEQVERLNRTVKDINELLSELRFGSMRYQFKVTPRHEVAELVSVIRKLSVLDEASRRRFREFIDERLEELRRYDDRNEIPELLDYRRWFDYRLCMSSPASAETELTRERRALGSGGEQGVPNYLLVLSLARLMFDNASARVRPLLFDEAFYGIDAGRREQLLRFATELGLQLVVASPDQDGATPAARRTTTLFLAKDDNGDVTSRRITTGTTQRSRRRRSSVSVRRNPMQRARSARSPPKQRTSRYL